MTTRKKLAGIKGLPAHFLLAAPFCHIACLLCSFYTHVFRGVWVGWEVEVSLVLTCAQLCSLGVFGP